MKNMFPFEHLAASVSPVPTNVTHPAPSSRVQLAYTLTVDRQVSYSVAGKVPHIPHLIMGPRASDEDVGVIWYESKATNFP